MVSFRTQVLKYPDDPTGVNYSTALIGNYSLAWIRKVAPAAAGENFYLSHFLQVYEKRYFAKTGLG
jgi:hypothetical protein|eukprot:COSAG06_NODE_1039_length_10995_cov_47.088106_4_plen_66_part_00